MNFSYDIGIRQALIKLGFSQLPEVTHPQMQMMGNTAIPEDVRDEELKNHIADVMSISLPDKQVYETRGKRTGGIAGTLLGGLTGGAIGGLIGGLKPTLMGSAAGALGGGALGRHFGGHMGESAHAEDTATQQHMSHMQDNLMPRRLELAKQVNALKDFSENARQQHELQLQQIPEQRINYNINPGS